MFLDCTKPVGETLSSVGEGGVRKEGLEAEGYEPVACRGSFFYKSSVCGRAPLLIKANGTSRSRNYGSRTSQCMGTSCRAPLHVLLLLHE